MRQYTRDWLRPDVMADLTAAAMVVPNALTFATIAARLLQVGLFTVFVPMR